MVITFGPAPILAQWSGPDAPDSLSFQGFLSDDSGVPIDDAVDMTFKLYKGANEVWSQTKANVAVNNGVFNVILGGTRLTSLDTVAFNVPIDLGIKVGTDSEISPRTPLTSAAFALGMRGMYAVSASDGDGNESLNVIGGAANNSVGADVVGATIGGGGGILFGGGAVPNSVPDDFGTVGGGIANTAGKFATVGGGESNTAGGENATVGGGIGNTAGGFAASVSGGGSNAATGTYAAVSGGSGNSATGNFATVHGGTANTASGQNSTVAGGSLNRARGGYSFAAGRRAKADHSGTFVWADSASSSGVDFLSTNVNQFPVRAAGGMGIGTNTPVNQFHVVGSANGSASDANHVALIENTSAGSGADVLALRIGNLSSPATTNAFVSFKYGSGTAGFILGNDAGGIELSSSGSDYAEYLAHRDPAEIMAPGDVVGILGGKVSLKTAGADQIMVVSTAPIVVGYHTVGEERPTGFSRVAFIGQAPVKILGPVRSGDFLIPSGNEDGTAIAVRPEDVRGEQIRLVFATAWESTDTIGIAKGNAAIGIDQSAAASRVIETLHERETQREEEIASIFDRLAVPEARMTN